MYRYIILIISMLGLSMNMYAFKAKEIKEKAFTEKYTKNGILVLNIKDNEKVYELNTNASIYHKYKVSQLSENYIFLNSSDIGTYMFSKNSSGKWDKFFTWNMEINKTKIYLIFPIDFRSNFAKPLDLIYIIFERDGALKKIELNGTFYVYGKFFKAKEDILYVYNGIEMLYFDTNSIFERK